MKTKFARYIWATLLCIVLIAEPGMAGADGRVLAAGNAPARNIGAFQLVSAEGGWLLLDERLYWSSVDGQKWTDITPRDIGGAHMAAAFFVNTHRGWLVLLQTDDSDQPVYSLAQTTDGGVSWQQSPLALFEPGDGRARAAAVHLDFLDAQTGWLVVKQATSSNFSIGTLFQTTDGGGHWTRLEGMPIGAPVHFDTPEIGWTAGGITGAERYLTVDGGHTWQRQALEADETAGSINALDMVTPQIGWARQTSGHCAAGGQCAADVQLMYTRDGGLSWTALELPPSTAAQANASPDISSAAIGPLNTSGRTSQFVGQGFDKCNIASLAQLQDWMLHSPYRAVNLYIGGVARGCGNSALTAAFLTQASQQGWKFIPTWVGPQAPCAGFSAKMSSDPPTAYNQGAAEANAAVETAAGLGLTLADKSGTVIYYNLEYYNTADTTCHNAAKAFITGWTSRLRARGNVVGVYGTTSAIRDFANLSAVPDVVWPAHWIYSTYNANASVWNVYNISNTLWVGHQRVRQYAGGHDESWGSTTLNIDSDVLDGVVADLSVPTSPPLPIRFYLPLVRR